MQAISEVHNGGAPMSSSIARKVIQSFHKESDSNEALSQREEQVLRYLAKGYLYKEIAERLSITFATVHTHVRNIYEKLHVRSRIEAVNKYLGK
jgi:DNA-binding NarL/FixJ family response regulator